MHRGDSDELQAARAQLVGYGTRLLDDGLAVGSAGNISVRVGDIMAITPSGIGYHDMRPGDVCLVTLDGTQLTDGGRQEVPSSETPMHLAIYAATSAAAVVHTHSPEVVALSAARPELPAIHYAITGLGGPVRVAPYVRFGSAGLAAAAVEALDGRTAAILRNHGAVTYGRDLAQAYDRALLLEWLARTYRLALSYGDPAILSPAELDEVAAETRRRRYGERRGATRLPGMPRTPDDMLSAVSQSLAARTGRSLPEWLALVQASGLDPLDQNAVRRWLRSEYGMPQNSQWAIADAAARSAGWVPPTVPEYLDRQYAGAKAALRPIYDALAAAIGRLGDDVAVEGRGGYIPFVRGRQFAAIAAAARDRVDLGLRFTDPPDTARLEPASGPGQATHKLSLRTVADVDDEVRHLLHVAYEQNA